MHHTDRPLHPGVVREVTEEGAALVEVSLDLPPGHACHGCPAANGKCGMTQLWIIPPPGEELHPGDQVALSTRGRSWWFQLRGAMVAGVAAFALGVAAADYQPWLSLPPALSERASVAIGLVAAAVVGGSLLLLGRRPVRVSGARKLAPQENGGSDAQGR